MAPRTAYYFPGKYGLGCAKFVHSPHYCPLNEQSGIETGIEHEYHEIFQKARGGIRFNVLMYRALCADGRCLYAPGCFMSIFTRLGAQRVSSRTQALYEYIHALRCSISIFIPIAISMIPPAASAFDLNLAPKMFPTFTPTADSIKVITPINETALIIST